MNALADINQALQQRGFVSIPSPISACFTTTRFESNPSDGWYFGILQAKKGPISAYLAIPDMDFSRAPSVWIPERPDWLIGWRPHLLSWHPPLSENLCYNDHGQFHLLPHEPGRAILRVLEDAVITIDRIADPTTVIEDSRREIALLWRGYSDSVFCDVEPESKNVLCSVGMAKLKGKNVFLISSSPIGLADKVGCTSPVIVAAQAIIYPEPQNPLYLTVAGPPKTLADVRSWLMETSSETYKRWHKVLMSQEHFTKRIYWHFFRTQSQLIGFKMDKVGNLSDIRGARQIRNFIRTHLYEKPADVVRVSPDRMDDSFLVRRNLPIENDDLRGLNILLIGCGTIGGYLAPALLQLGAGLDKITNKGCLTLCDGDVLSNQNIGRHALGLNFMGMNKAVALKMDLVGKRSNVHIDAIEKKVDTIESDFKNFHLIINATGYEPIGRRLSRALRSEEWYDSNRALLHVWIEGRGGVSRALLEDSKKCACFDCMWAYSVNQEPKSRYPAYQLDEWYERANDGYATMTPFSVSASLASTALAIDSILSWRSKKPSPRFRSRSAEGVGIKASFSNDLQRNEKCPTCSI
tara:strand:- start:146009 stop:147748 length:1740 start_codon:yes stop_codon:yes gene_type:complete